MQPRFQACPLGRRQMARDFSDLRIQRAELQLLFMQLRFQVRPLGWRQAARDFSDLRTQRAELPLLFMKRRFQVRPLGWRQMARDFSDLRIQRKLQLLSMQRRFQVCPLGWRQMVRDFSDRRIQPLTWASSVVHRSGGMRSAISASRARSLAWSALNRSTQLFKSPSLSFKPASLTYWSVEPSGHRAELGLLFMNCGFCVRQTHHQRA